MFLFGMSGILYSYRNATFLCPGCFRLTSFLYGNMWVSRTFATYILPLQAAKAHTKISETNTWEQLQDSRKSGNPSHYCFTPLKSRLISSNRIRLATATSALSSNSASVLGDSVELDSPVPPQDAIPPSVSFDWCSSNVEKSKLPLLYLKLAKYKLSAMVVVTALSGYVMAPGSVDLSTLLPCLIGTGFLSSGANALNQVFEVPYDSQMARTKQRVLVRGQLTSLHGALFAILSGAFGFVTLYTCVNPLTASLGALNFLLYTSVYTPLKRTSIVNTWVGSVVGAVPPMMGWTAACAALHPGAWLMGGILYAWQFPHFNALSWNLRPDYSKAGYRMMAVTDPGLCRRVTLRYSFALLAMCSCAPLVDLTTWHFAVDSLPLNVYLIYLGEFENC
ncbi:unnamed protein product [Cyprideis torosa]|uniref:Protoheme IX farnesyltransferase, mitochondrial n=1 Tax=Cyprideis torosa TaxID=163714 RepID=A0A7R8ZUB4_9CRUS|nr:unnamed protein product [Cyprideis torosa]CAG0900039.1 unnamed protein product [Cyprideis torosa]